MGVERGGSVGAGRCFVEWKKNIFSLRSPSFAFVLYLRQEILTVGQSTSREEKNRDVGEGGSSEATKKWMGTFDTLFLDKERGN
jgi:hypothetical protein